MQIIDLKVEGEGEKEYREYPVYGAAAQVFDSAIFFSGGYTVHHCMDRIKCQKLYV